MSNWQISGLAVQVEDGREVVRSIHCEYCGRYVLDAPIAVAAYHIYACGILSGAIRYADGEDEE